jgi:antitoxin component YwqK of YwqJK toxin-antitoxin module
MIFYLLSLCIAASAQDTSAEKQTNFSRKRGMADNTTANYETKVYVLENGDTLVQKFARALYTNEILRESTYFHNKKNGLEITYYPNGMVSTINFYLDGKLWETISRADTSGRLIDPGNLRNGTGVVPIYSVYGFDSLGYETYKNGYPEGPFAVKGTSYLTKGDLTYKKSAVNYLPAKRVTYTNTDGKVCTDVFGDHEYASLFLDTGQKNDLKILTVTNDSVIEESRDFTYLPLPSYFPDPAIIPKGVWTITDIRNNKMLESVLHDDAGNPIKVVKYKENGDILWTGEFPPCSKRKQLKRVAGGGINGEFCPI